MQPKVRTNSSIRRTSRGRIALFAAGCAGLAGAATARADLAGFSGFATPNVEGNTPNPYGYSSDGSTFYLTDGGGGEGVSGFATNQQLITSFDASFTLKANGAADGIAFIVQNSAQGTAALGGGGGSAGYEGINNSAGIQTEYYFGAQANGVQSASGFSTNGAGVGFYYTGNVPLNTGDPIRTTVSYYNNTLQYTFLDLNTKATTEMKYTNVNIPAAVAGNTAYVGFSGATGGAASSQNISGFNYTSAPSFTPIALTASSFNQDMVVEKGASQTGARSAVTADFDSGTGNVGETFYEQGYDTAAPTTGLPASGSTFSADASHSFKMQSYTGNNALLIGSNGSSSGTLTLSTPKAYRELSLLGTSGDGDQPVSVTINFAGGAPSITVPDVVIQDWFGTGVTAYDAQGRVTPGASGTASTFDNVNNGNPNLWEVDFTVPDTTDLISSVTLTSDEAAGSNSKSAIFALSGAAVVAQGTLVYSGTGTPAASFDTTGSLNFQSNGTPTAFGNGNSVIFDDTATGSTTVTVQGAGVSPTLMTFNNSSKAYVFNGGAISAVGASFNGSNSVTFNDTVTFSGAATVNAGNVIIGTTGNLSAGTISIGASGTLSVATGGKLAGAPPVTDNGNLNLNSGATTVGALTGAGTVTLNGTSAASGTSTLVAGVGTNFTGTFNGSLGAFNLAGGIYSAPVRQPSSIYALTGGIYVGMGNTSAAFLFNDNSGQFGQTSSGAPLTITIGGNGTLESGAGNGSTWGGNIVLAANSSTGGVATIAAGGGGSFTIVTPITGTGPLSYPAPVNGSSYNLNVSSSYTGETRLGAPVSQSDTNQITLNAENGISPNGGINFGGGAGALVLELNGHNQSTAYLSGGGTGGLPGLGATTALQDSAGTPSTLTITNGSLNGFASAFGAPITGNISIIKSGAGNQILSAANTYNGTTKITGGTLTAAGTTAFSNSVITLSGGKLGLSGVVSNAAASITSFANFQTNLGGASGTTGANGTLPSSTPYITADNSTLEITSDDGQEANSAFLKTPITLASAGFYTNFIYQNDEGADGIAFVIQNDIRGASAIGGPGGALGYSNQGSTTVTSIAPSVAIEFNIYGGNAGPGTGIGLNGVISDNAALGNIDFAGDPNPLAVSIVYNAQAQTVTETVTDTTNGSSGTATYTGVNYASTLGGNTGYIGFTGGTGGSVSNQTVSNFSYGSLGNGPVSIANAVTTTAGNTSGIELNVTNGFQSASIGSLTVVAGAKVVIDAVASGTATRGVLTIPTLTIAGTNAVPTGVIDIQNNDLDLPGASLSQVSAWVKAGYNNGSFTGQGITSANAAANTSHVTAVGVIINNDGKGNALYGSSSAAGTLFDGSNPSLNDILVKYTYFGDANLDGKVDGSDYSLIDAGYAADKASAGSATGWYSGDFNYDGTVDGSDYALIDNAYNLQGAPKTGTSSALVASSTAEVAGPTAVPEPTTLGLAMVGGLSLIRRRRAR